MSYGYSINLRERVLSYIDDGHTQKEASEVFKIPRQTIYNWFCLKSETGGLRMRHSGKRHYSKFDAEKLKETLILPPDYYLSEIAVVFKVTPSSVCRALKRCGITRKKRAFSSRNEITKSVKSFSAV